MNVPVARALWVVIAIQEAEGQEAIQPAGCDALHNMSTRPNCALWGTTQVQHTAGADLCFPWKHRPQKCVL